MDIKYSETNKTFARRIGRSLSQASKNIIENTLPNYLYNKDLLNKQEKICLEIGFGNGEHLINQLTNNPDTLFIGVEAYLNGVASFLKNAIAKNLQNFLIWPNNFDLILDEIPHNSLDAIYILFPDPWHKQRYLKKRLVNSQRLVKLKQMLKPGGFLAFGSDIEDYYENVFDLIEQSKDFKILNENNKQAHANYIQTKYHLKAMKEGRTARFIQARLERTG